MTTFRAIIATGERDIFGDVLTPEALKMFAEQAPGMAITFNFSGPKIGEIEQGKLEGDTVVVDGVLDLDDIEEARDFISTISKREYYIAPGFTMDNDGNPIKLMEVAIVAQHADPNVPPLEIVP